MNFRKYKRLFFWNNSSPKLKHETLCDDYKTGGLKNFDILNKIIALQCSWIRRLYDNSFHDGIEELKNYLALHLSFIEIYSLKVIKLN